MNEHYLKRLSVSGFANSMRQPLTASLLAISLSYFAYSNAAAQTSPPPAIGEETKGQPAIDEAPAASASSDTAAPTSSDDSSNDEQTASKSPFGTATITESKRESGQRYRIELEHSLGGTQYIEENDSDGKLESTPGDVEDTPNLPKWKIGSW